MRTRRTCHGSVVFQLEWWQWALLMIVATMTMTTTTTKTPTITFVLSLAVTPDRNGPKSLDALREQRTSRLKQAFSSPSGKLTYSPEVTLPEVVDWTALALQANAVQGLSQKLRQAKANAIFLEGSLTALRTLATEQASVLSGSFPAPVPIVYCSSLNPSDEERGPTLAEQLMEISEAGADGLLVPVSVGNGEKLEEDMTSSPWVQICQTALECGVQPIPELLVVDSSSGPMTGSVSEWIDQVCTALGFDPVALTLTMQIDDNNNYENDLNDSSTAQQEQQQQPEDPSRYSVSGLPFYPRSTVEDDATATTNSQKIQSRIPILGSIQLPAGEGRLQAESNRLKHAGYFVGAVLKRQCLPLGLQPSTITTSTASTTTTTTNNNNRNDWNVLEILGPFWASCLQDLKSTKSKAFSFRAKNQMDQSVATQWGNYQKSVIESGALGDPQERFSPSSPSSGDYQGF